MFERFTERARQVVVLAQEEARALKHNYIGTEHILLGLLREQEGVAARVLASFDITVERARAQVVRIVSAGEEVTSGQIPFTPRAKQVLELALREMLSLGHNDIGTEHILLGLTRVHEGVAMRVLLAFDADAEKVRDETIRRLSGPGSRSSSGSVGVSSASVPVLGRTGALGTPWLDGLEELLESLAQEIRDRLDREPDAGDLLLALACAPETISGQALSELGVDLDALAGAVTHARAQIALARAQSAARHAEMRQEITRRLGIPRTGGPSTEPSGEPGV
jgi:ATP-dependent Clp protease ATP-binding subunit ClpA